MAKKTSFFQNLILGLVALSMVSFWGMGQIFYTSPGKQIVAESGPYRVTMREYMLEMALWKAALLDPNHAPPYHVNMEKYTNAAPFWRAIILDPKAPLEAKKQWAYDLARELLRRKVVDAQVKKAGLWVSDDVVYAEIRKIPLVYDEQRRFDLKRWRQFLKSICMTDSEYREYIRSQKMRNQWTQAMMSLVEPPKFYTQTLWNGLHGSRHGVAWAFPINAYANNQKTPSLQVLKDFYAKNQEQFRVPEWREVEVGYSQDLKDSDLESCEDRLASGASMAQAGQEHKHWKVWTMKITADQADLSALPRNLAATLQGQLTDIRKARAQDYAPYFQGNNGGIWRVVSVHSAKTPDFSKVKPLVLKAYHRLQCEQKAKEQAQQFVKKKTNLKPSKILGPIAYAEIGDNHNNRQIQCLFALDEGERKMWKLDDAYWVVECQECRSATTKLLESFCHRVDTSWKEKWLAAYCESIIAVAPTKIRYDLITAWLVEEMRS